MLLHARCKNATKELADAKAESDALRDDVAAGRQFIKAICQSVREATTASAAWINMTSPDWQTPLSSYFTLRG